MLKAEYFLSALSPCLGSSVHFVLRGVLARRLPACPSPHPDVVPGAQIKYNFDCLRCPPMPPPDGGHPGENILNSQQPSPLPALNVSVLAPRPALCTASCTPCVFLDALPAAHRPPPGEYQEEDDAPQGFLHLPARNPLACACPPCYASPPPTCQCMATLVHMSIAPVLCFHNILTISRV